MDERPEIPIKVVVRVRPFVGQERIINSDKCVSVLSGNRQLVIGRDRQYEFDYIFGPQSSQQEVYDNSIQRLVIGCFDGFNGTVLAYGQTGSGKTYTMGTGNLLRSSNQGILPQAIKEIFLIIARKKEQGQESTSVKVSFIEIYMEELRDLLSAQGNEKELYIRDDENGSTVVFGLHEVTVTSEEDVMNCLETGAAVRRTGNTRMNEDSSRSHCIFILTIEQASTASSGYEDCVISAKFCVADLAGSERAHRTGNQGERFRESIFINNGLLALGNVISALTDKKRRNAHIPYRDSKLTRLLKDSLGGNSNAVLVTCLSPSIADLEENLNSIKFSIRAKSVRNKPTANQELKPAQILQMKDEIMALKGELLRQKLAAVPFCRDDKVGCHEDHLLSQSEVERYRNEIMLYLRHVNEADAILTCCQRSLDVADDIYQQIKIWKENIARLLQNTDLDMTRALKEEDMIPEYLNSEKGEVLRIRQLLEDKRDENDALQLRVSGLKAENVQLSSDVSELIGNKKSLQRHVVEQQLQFLHDQRNGFLDRALMGEEHKIVKSFRARSHVLVSTLEDRDEVAHDATDLFNGDEGNNNLEENSFERADIYHENLAQELTVFPENLTSLRMSTNVSRTKLGDIKVDIQDALRRLNELNSLIKQKEGLLKVIANSNKEMKDCTTILKEKFKGHKKETDYIVKELEEAKQMYNENNIEIAMEPKLENEYRKKIYLLERKLAELEKNKKDSKTLSAMRDTSERRMKNLENHIERLRSHQDQLQRQLKEEKEIKTKLETDVRRGEQKVKELEIKTESQQRVLKRKTEEVAAAQRKLRMGSAKVENKRLDTKMETQKQWFDTELEKLVGHNRKLSDLKEDLKRRQEILERKEALIAERVALENKRTRASLLLSQDTIRLSSRLEEISQQLNELQSQGRTEKKKNQTDVDNLIETKTELEKQKKTLEARLEYDTVIDIKEERRLQDLIQGIETLETTIQYKSDLILEKEHAVRNCQPADVCIANLECKLGELSKDEIKSLLSVYLTKVVALKDAECQAKLDREMMEVRVEEQAQTIQELEHVLTLQESQAEKFRVGEQVQYEEKIQFLLLQIKELSKRVEDDTHRTQEKRINLLEKELRYYKKASRELKKKLRDLGEPTWGLAESQTSGSGKLGSVLAKEELLKLGGSHRESGDCQDYHDVKEIKQSNESGSRKENGNWLSNRESTENINYRSRSTPDTVKEEICKVLPHQKEVVEPLRLPPVQVIQKDIKSYWDRSRNQSNLEGLGSQLEKQSSDQHQFLKEIFESQPSLRLTKKAGDN